MTSLKNNIRIAVQKNGRLCQASLGYLADLGLLFSLPKNRELIVPCRNAPVELLLVRNCDIPAYVQHGVAEFGIVGKNVLCEQGQSSLATQALEFGQCSLVIAVPEQSQIQCVQDLSGERIATSYPETVRKFLAERNIPASLIVIEGSVEIAPELGLADAICDITQTGETLRAHGLTPIFTVLESQAQFIESPFLSSIKKEAFKNFYEKILSGTTLTK